MAINLQQIIDSPLSIKLASALGRGLPMPLGYRLADFAAARLAGRRDSPLVRAVRSNQWVVHGESLDGNALNQAVYENIQHTARSIFSLYHYIGNLEAARRLIVMDEATRLLLQRSEFSERGLMIAGLHISNFDLVMQSLFYMRLPIMVLTIPNPQGGRRAEFELRQKTKMNLVPASLEAFRQAVRYLRQGGVVLSGIDRPAPEAGYRPRFFGRPTALPTHHIFLAAKAQVPVMIIATNLQPDGKYRIYTSEMIEMDHHPDRERGIILNAEKVLSIAEGFIRRVPQQWSMSLPVWPETLDLVPD